MRSCCRLCRHCCCHAHGLLTFVGSYMAERMVFGAKELLVERAAMEEAMAKEEVRTELQLRSCCCFQ
jgi:hypothetical protein